MDIYKKIKLLNINKIFKNKLVLIGLSVFLLISIATVILISVLSGPKPISTVIPTKKKPPVSFLVPENKTDPDFNPNWNPDFIPKTDNNLNNSIPEEEKTSDKTEYLEKYPNKIPEVPVTDLTEIGLTQNRWLAIPNSRIVINPFPKIDNNKYITTTQQVDYSNRTNLPLNMGYLSPNAIDYRGIFLTDTVTMYTGETTLAPAKSYSTKWSQYANFFQAEYENGLKLEGKDFFCDENTIIRTIDFANINDQNKLFTLGGSYLGAPSVSAGAFVFKSSSMSYIITGNYDINKNAFFANDKDFLDNKPISGDVGREGYWKTNIDLSNYKTKSLILVIHFVKTDETVKESIVATKNIVNSNIYSYYNKRIQLWNNFLAAVPQPTDFELSAINNKNNITAQIVKEQYYKAWLFLASDILPNNPEVYYDYPQFACGKPSMWGYGDAAKAPYTSTWESLEAMQMFSLVDPDIAMKAFTGVMQLVDLKTGLIIGESLPPVRAETAMVLFKNSGNIEFLKDNYEAIKKSLEWSMQYPSWIFGNGHDITSRDSDFSFAALNDMQHIKEIAKLLGKTDEVKLLSSQYNDYVEKCFKWHWESSMAIPNEYSKEDINGNITERAQAHIVTLANALSIDGFDGSRIDGVKRAIDKEFNSDNFYAGFTHNKHTNVRLTYYGMLKRGMVNEAEQLIDATLRDNTSTNTFAEGISKNDKGEVYPTGVRPSIFSCVSVIDTVLLKNGYNSFAFEPIVANINSTKNIGINNISIGRKALNIRRKANASEFVIGSTNVSVGKGKQTSVQSVSLNAISDLFTIKGNVSNINLNSTTAGVKFLVDSSDSNIVKVELNGMTLKVTSENNGSAVITVVAFADGYTYKLLTFNVNVGIPKPNINLDGLKDITMDTGEIRYREIDIYPTGGRLTAISSNSCVEVKIIGNKLYIIAKEILSGSSDRATVILTYEKEGYNSATTSFNAIISKPSVFIEKIKGVSVTINSSTILTNDIYPFDVSAQFSVDNTSIATCELIQENGRAKLKINGKSVGKTTASITLSKIGYENMTMEFPIYVNEDGVLWKADFTEPSLWQIGYKSNPGGSTMTADGDKGKLKVTDLANPPWQVFKSFDFEVDLNKTPFIELDVQSITGGNWALKAQVSSNSDISLITDNSNTGKFYIDLAERSGKSGKQKVSINFYVIGINAEAILNGIKVYDGRDLGIEKPDDTFIEIGKSKTIPVKVYNSKTELVAETDGKTNVVVNQDKTLTIKAITLGESKITLYPNGEKDTKSVEFIVNVLHENIGYKLLMNNNDSWHSFGEPGINAIFNDNKVILKANGGWGGYAPKQKLKNIDLTVYNKLVVDVESATCVWDAQLYIDNKNIDWKFFTKETGSFKQASGRYVFDLTSIEGLDLSSVSDFNIGIYALGSGMVSINNISLERDINIGTIETKNIGVNEQYTTKINGLKNGTTFSATTTETNVLDISVIGDKLTVKGIESGKANVKITATNGIEKSEVFITFIVGNGLSLGNIFASMPMEPNENWATGGATPPTVSFINGMVQLNGNGSWGNYGTIITGFDPDIYKYIELDIQELSANGGNILLKITSLNGAVVDKEVLTATTAGKYYFDLSSFTQQEKQAIKTNGISFCLYVMGNCSAKIKEYKITKIAPQTVGFTAPMDSTSDWSAQYATAATENGVCILTPSVDNGFYGGPIKQNNGGKVNLELYRYLVVDIAIANDWFYMQLWNGEGTYDLQKQSGGNGVYVFDLKDINSNYFGTIQNGPTFNINLRGRANNTYKINSIKLVSEKPVENTVGLNAPMDSTNGWSAQYGVATTENNMCVLTPNADGGYYGGSIQMMDARVNLTKYHYVVVDVAQADGWFYLQLWNGGGETLLPTENGGSGIYVYDLNNIDARYLGTINDGYQGAFPTFNLNFKAQANKTYKINSMKLMSVNPLGGFVSPMNGTDGWGPRFNTSYEYNSDGSCSLTVGSELGGYGGKIRSSGSLDLNTHRYALINVEDVNGQFYIQLWNDSQAIEIANFSSNGVYVFDLKSKASEEYLNSANVFFTIRGKANGNSIKIKGINLVSVNPFIGFTASTRGTGGWGSTFNTTPIYNSDGSCSITVGDQLGGYGGDIKYSGNPFDLNVYHYAVIDVTDVNGQFYVQLWNDSQAINFENFNSSGVYVIDLKMLPVPTGYLNSNRIAFSIRGRNNGDTIRINSIKFLSQNPNG